MIDMQRGTKWAVLISAALVLTACGSTISGPDYKTAGARRAPLDIPPDLVSPTSNDRFSVPQAGDGTTLSEYERSRRENVANDSTLAPKFSNVSIERDGQVRWLKLKMPPAQAWQSVREFLQESGFVIASESPEIGVIQTDWAEKRAKVSSGVIRDALSRAFGTQYATGERDAFKARIEAVDDGSEVYLSHRGMEEVIAESLDGDTRWQPRGTDPTLEVELLRRMMMHFGASEEQSKVAAAKVQEPEPSLADMIQIDGSSVLQINEGFDRAWRRVGLALDRSGFTVEDRDRSLGTYFVRYIDTDQTKEKPGALARLFGVGDQKEEQRKYRIVVADNGEQANVTVQAREKGDPQVSSSDTARRMLGLIQEKLGR